jgi:hypothetical protein
MEEHGKLFFCYHASRDEPTRYRATQGYDMIRVLEAMIHRPFSNVRPKIARMYICVVCKSDVPRTGAPNRWYHERHPNMRHEINYVCNFMPAQQPWDITAQLGNPPGRRYDAMTGEECIDRQQCVSKNFRKGRMDFVFAGY